jgi:hypothetical protein
LNLKWTIGKNKNGKNMQTHQKSVNKKAQGSATSARALANGAPRTNGKAPIHLIIANRKRNASGLSTGKNRRKSSTRSRRKSWAWVEKLKLKEQWLRQEIRANRTLMLGLFQWGLTVLVGMETCMYYIRRDVATNLALHGSLPANGTIPPVRWFVGSVVLAIVAFLFCSMNRYLIQRQVAYRTQLIAMVPSFSGIKERPTGGKINRYHYLLFFAIPVLDVLLWFYFRLTASITIPW